MLLNYRPVWLASEAFAGVDADGVAHVVHTISERAEALLDAAGVRWFQLDARTPIEDWAPTIERAWEFAHTTHRPVFVLVNLMNG